MITMDSQLQWLGGGIIGLLVISSLITWLIARKQGKGHLSSGVANLVARVKAWWVMCVILALVLVLGPIPTVVMYALLSFLALREFITLTPTNKGDHPTLFWCFFVILPMQYIFVGMQWYGLFIVFIPVYAFLLIPVRIAISGDSVNFMERTAKIQWGVLISIFFLSHIPALLMLDIPGYQGQNIKLLLYIVVITQLSDVLQYVFGKMLGKHPIAPTLSPNKTVEGFVGGGLSAVGVGTALYMITPFNAWQSSLMSLVIVLAGFAGGLCMSAVKRDRGIKDFGATIQGHGGIMDRMDSVCFAAPVFFHLTRYFFT